MEDAAGIRTGDLITLLLYFAVTVGIGVWCARRMSSTEGYFVGGRAMPGWAVGISIIGTAISSVTFLAYPGSAFVGDWSRLVPNFTIPVGAIVAVLVFVPFYRRARIVSVNEYLERRFAPWARAYSCVMWSLIQFFRMGIILFLIALAVNAMTGFSISLLIVVLGILIIVYTVMGGIEAVIWTDVIQTIVLMVGGLVCIAVVFLSVPGGASGVFSQAIDADKFHLTAKLDWDFTTMTLWVAILFGLNQNIQEFASDQTKVQRYCAASTDKQAINATLFGGIGCIPVWIVFMFVGTCLWAFYTVAFPAVLPASIMEDQVFPYFILTELPIGVSGFVMAAVMAAAMSSIDSSLNGTAAVITSDLYKRFFVSGKDDAHYLTVGRKITIVCGVVMIISSWGLYNIITAGFIEQKTFLDSIFFFYALLAGGVGGLFMLGFFTTRANSQGVLIGVIFAVIVTLWMSASSLGLMTGESASTFHKLMIGVVSNVVAFALGYGFSYLFPKPSHDNLSDLTIWTWNKYGSLPR